MSYKTTKHLTTSVLTLLLCTTLVSCGSDKKSNRGKVVKIEGAQNPTGEPIDRDEDRTATEDITIPTDSANTNNGNGSNNGPAPIGGQNNGTGVQNGPPSLNGHGNNNAQVGGNSNASTTGGNTEDTTSAPIGNQTGKKSNESSKTEGSSKDSKKAPSVSGTNALTTGGKAGNALNYTTNSDDRVMELFKTLEADGEQAAKNKQLAESIVGAKFKKVGSGFELSLAVNEAGETKYYEFSGIDDGHVVSLGLSRNTGGLEFQGGFAKCLSLNSTCNEAYAKIKLQGAYTRIIFRVNDLNTHFLFRQGSAGSDYELWKTYAQNSITGADASKALVQMRASSYEVLNGKSAVGIKLVAKNRQVVNMSTLLVAPASGTKVQVPMSFANDLSVNYNLESVTGGSTDLMKVAKSVKLVANNGRGDIHVNVGFAQGQIDMIFSKVKTDTMTAQQVQAFEASVPTF